MTMKTTQIILLALTTCFASCYEDYTHDYETTNAGFALQTPLRTVISDRDMSIYVGVSLGGKREVDMNDWAKFSLDASLLEGTPLTLLPKEYYTLEDSEIFRVRKSNLPVADVEIKFTDAFYADPLSLTTHYALPFKVTESSMNTIREGADYSIVAIKYISSFSGVYYLQGEVSEIDNNGNIIEGTTVTYKEKDLISNSTLELSTLSKNKLLRPGVANLAKSDINRFVLTIDNNGESGADYNIHIEEMEGGVTIIEGNGNYIAQSPTYTFNNGDKPCPEINLDYIYELADKRYKVKEQLILRRDPLDDLRVESWK